MRNVLFSLAIVLTAFSPASAQPAREGKDRQMPIHKIEGQWTPIYVEMDGKKIDLKDFTQVTIKNSILTCRHEGKEKSYKLEFGPHHMIRCTELPGSATATSANNGAADKRMHTHHGVYIASHEYFCVCLDKGPGYHGTAPAREQANQNNAGQQGAPAQGIGREGHHHPHGSDLVIILHRTGGKILQPTR